MPTTKRIRLGIDCGGPSGEVIGVIEGNRHMNRSREIANRYLSRVLLSSCVANSSKFDDDNDDDDDDGGGSGGVMRDSLLSLERCLSNIAGVLPMSSSSSSSSLPSSLSLSSKGGSHLDGIAPEYARGLPSLVLYRNPGSCFLRPAFVRCIYTDNNNNNNKDDDDVSENAENDL